MVFWPCSIIYGFVPGQEIYIWLYWPSTRLLKHYVVYQAIYDTVIFADGRLDQILLTFGSLCMHFNNLRNQDPGDYAGCTAIIDSIEKHWAKADQDVFIAAVILNLFFKCGPFSSKARSWSEASILALLQRLYKHFFSFTEWKDELEVNLNTLYSNVGEYLASEGQGICDGMTLYVKGMELAAATPRSKSSLDPLQVYRAMTPQNMAPSPFFKLANHILSICPNSALCERLFSVFGNTLTKLRNCLGNQTLMSLAKLKMHICDEHLCSNKTKLHVKRLFSADNTLSSSAIISPAPNPSAIVSPAADPSAIVSPAAAPSAVSPIVDPQLEALSTPAQAVSPARDKRLQACLIEHLVE